METVWGKVGEFASNLLGTVYDRANLASAPFATIFGSVVPIAAWIANPFLGILFFGLETLGIGASEIGKIIDQTLGFSGKGVKPIVNLSDASEAAKRVVDTIVSKVGQVKESSLDTNFDINAEFKTMENLCIISSYDKNFIKVSVGKKALVSRFLRGLVNNKGTKLSLIKVLTGFIWAMIKGLMAFGVIGAAVKTFGKNKGTITDPDSLFPSLSIGAQKGVREVPHRVPSGWLYYKNVRKDVQDTLISYFNGKMPTFSNLFYKENNRQLYNSPQMMNLLKFIEKHNYASVVHLNSVEGFVAPKIEVMMERIIPGYKFTSVDMYKPKKQNGGVK